MDVNKLFSLDGKVALITGGSRGIGKMILAGYLAAGCARVYITARKREQIAETVAEFETQYPGKVIGLPGDLSQMDEIKRLVGEIAARESKLDILVNNAGIVSTLPLLQVSAAEWKRVMAIDLNSVFYCAKAVLPGMMARRSGRIINIASVAGKRGGGLLGNSCYAAAKGGVIALTKGLAREAGPFNITANAVSPALTDTDMTSALSPDARARVLADMPLGRAGTPRDIAAAVCFLASDAASFVSGEIMDVDGGYMRD